LANEKKGELFQIGSKLFVGDSESCQIEKYLGGGSQGEVYCVSIGGKKYALKWYFPPSATNTQRDILEKLIKRGTPSDVFLWPQRIVNGSSENSFGYIMELFPNNFKSLVDLMKRHVDPSFNVVCRAAFNLTCGYEKLHSMGYSYRDISFGNLRFDPNTGDVLICDNDNVSANEDSAVYGTPRFMAPEIILGKAKPSRNTDLFSLSVLLFYMLMLHHPLEGKLEAEINSTFAKNLVFTNI